MFRWMVHNAQSCGWYTFSPLVLFISSLLLSHRIIFRGSLRWDLSSFSSHTHTHTHKEEHTLWIFSCLFTSLVVPVNYACRGGLLGRWRGLTLRRHAISATLVLVDDFKTGSKIDLTSHSPGSPSDPHQMHLPSASCLTCMFQNSTAAHPATTSTHSATSFLITHTPQALRFL